MPLDDELAAQLRAFGETLQDRTGEPIGPSALADLTVTRSANQPRWWVFAAAAAIVAVVVASVFVIVGGADEAAVNPATLSGVDPGLPPTVDSRPAPTTGETTAPTTATSDDGLVLRQVEPFVFSGTGSRTVDFPLDPMIFNLAGYIEVTHDGSGPFSVTQVSGSADGEIAEKSVLDTVGSYQGRREWRLIEGDTSPRSIDVVADGNWSLELRDLVTWDVFVDYAPDTVISGSGDAVFQPFAASGAPASLIADFECSGCAGDIDVIGVHSGTQVIVDGEGDGGTYRASGILPKAVTFLLVQTHSPEAPGDWTITLRESAPETTADSDP